MTALSTAPNREEALLATLTTATSPDELRIRLAELTTAITTNVGPKGQAAVAQAINRLYRVAAVVAPCFDSALLSTLLAEPYCGMLLAQ